MVRGVRLEGLFLLRRVRLPAGEAPMTFPESNPSKRPTVRDLLRLGIKERDERSKHDDAAGTRRMGAAGEPPRGDQAAGAGTGRDRASEYRDLLEAWTAWWNNIGRYNFPHPLGPPLTKTAASLPAPACKGVGWYKAKDGPGRCQVCLRRLP